MKKLNRRDMLLVGLTLFSMFFGAGNLIFPPFLGAQAGHSTWIAMVGFSLSAIGLPILGVVAVAKSGGLPALAGRVGPHFAWVFTLLVYLSIGPGLAIPRTASTSFEMAVTPFWPDTPGWVLPCYAAVFFTVAMLIAFRPEKLTDRLGKVLGPVLLALICIIVAGCLIHAPGGYGAPTGKYVGNVLSQGFVDGYQTMDTIAALNFGIIIALNIQNRGVTESRYVVSTTIRAGWIAGAVLLVVYAALAHVGAVSGGAFPGATNGAGVLTNLVSWLYGPVGSVLLGLVFVIACLNTCIGLFSCCSEYFCQMVPKISYRVWVAIFAGDQLPDRHCGPGYHFGGFHARAKRHLSGGNCADYPGAGTPADRQGAWLLSGRSGLHRNCERALCAGHGQTAGAVCDGAGAMLPLYTEGLCWLLPALVGGILGALLSRTKRK